MERWQRIRAIALTVALLIAVSPAAAVASGPSPQPAPTDTDLGALAGPGAAGDDARAHPHALEPGAHADALVDAGADPRRAGHLGDPAARRSTSRPQGSSPTQSPRSRTGPGRSPMPGIAARRRRHVTHHPQPAPAPAPKVAAVHRATAAKHDGLVLAVGAVVLLVLVATSLALLRRVTRLHREVTTA